MKLIVIVAAFVVCSAHEEQNSVTLNPDEKENIDSIIKSDENAIPMLAKNEFKSIISSIDKMKTTLDNVHKSKKDPNPGIKAIQKRFDDFRKDAESDNSTAIFTGIMETKQLLKKVTYSKGIVYFTV